MDKEKNDKEIMEEKCVSVAGGGNSLYRDEALEAKLEELRDVWANNAQAIDKIYGLDTPAANVYRLCIRAVGDAINKEIKNEN